jgi:thiol-disulfide isomerase/thioredoxin
MYCTRRRFGVGLSAIGAIALLSLRGMASAQDQPTPAAMEATAPPLPALGSYLALPPGTFLDGRTYNPEQAKGRVTLVYWWSSTCPFCALQSPEIEKLWLAYKGRGLEVLALSVDRKAQDATQYLQKKGYSFPSAWVTPDIQRLMPKPRGLPITLVRGRDGKVLQAERGQMFPEDIEQLAKWI